MCDYLKRGDIVLATYGYNPVLKEPFSFLYDFGYYNTNGDCIVYNHGECNMQDAHCFKKEQVRLATQHELQTEFFGL